MLYSFNNNYPVSNLPDRITLSNGMTRTDSSTFTESELLDAGWIAVSDPPQYNPQTHKLIWTGTVWNVSPFTENELIQQKYEKWKEIRKQRDEKIREIEWRITRNLSEQRLGITPTELLGPIDSYIQELRDITKQPDPFNINWPIVPTTPNGMI